MKHIFLLILLNTLLHQAFAQPDYLINSGSTQLLVVKTDGLNTRQGTLNYYEWDSKSRHWTQVIGPVAVVVGRNGLAWGDGMVKAVSETGPVKREGDGRAPAGLFRLGACFGYDAAPAGLKMPYLQSTIALRCVDDPASAHYNQVLNEDTVSRKDWNSAEYMKLKSGDDYKLGLIVEYNTKPALVGKGSCIFVHLWESPTKGTSGCTAFSEEVMRTLLKKLDGRKKPVLAQLPAKSYARWQQKYGLP